MDLITDDLNRALGFLHACSIEGQWPTPSQLDLYITTKQPRPGHSTSNMYQVALRNMQALMGTTWIPGEKVSSYLLEVCWAELVPSEETIRLTKLGRSLLKGLKATDEMYANEVTVRTASPENPISLGQILNLIQTKQSETIVDPYLGFDEFELLLQTGIKRILTTKINLNTGIQAMIAELDASEKVEVRVADKEKLHDRVIIHRNGGVALVGTSMNSTRNTYTSLVDLPASIGLPIAKGIDKLWAQSEPLANLELKKKR